MQQQEHSHTNRLQRTETETETRTHTYYCSILCRYCNKNNNNNAHSLCGVERHAIGRPVFYTYVGRLAIIGIRFTVLVSPEKMESVIRIQLLRIPPPNFELLRLSLVVDHIPGVDRRRTTSTVIEF